MSSRINILVKFKIYSLEDDYYIVGSSNTGSFTERIGSATKEDGTPDLYHGSDDAAHIESNGAEVSKVIPLGEKYGDYRIRMYAENQLGIRSAYVEIDKMIRAPDVKGTFRFNDIKVSGLMGDKPSAYRRVLQTPVAVSQNLELKNKLSVESEFVSRSCNINWTLKAPLGFSGNPKGSVVGKNNADLFESLFSHFDINVFKDKPVEVFNSSTGLVDYEDDAGGTMSPVHQVKGTASFDFEVSKQEIESWRGANDQTREIYVDVVGYDVYHSTALAEDKYKHRFSSIIKIENIRSELDSGFADLYGNRMNLSYVNKDPDFFNGFVVIKTFKSEGNSADPTGWDNVENKTLRGSYGDYSRDQKWSSVSGRNYYKYVFELHDSYGLCFYYGVDQFGNLTSKSQSLDFTLNESYSWEASVLIGNVTIRESGSDFLISWDVEDSRGHPVTVSAPDTGGDGRANFSMGGTIDINQFVGFTAHFECPEQYKKDNSVDTPIRDCFNLRALGIDSDDGTNITYKKGSPEMVNGEVTLRETIDVTGVYMADNKVSITSETSYPLTRKENADLYRSWFNSVNKSDRTDEVSVLYREVQDSEYELKRYSSAGEYAVDAQRRIKVTIGLVDATESVVHSKTSEIYNEPPTFFNNISINGVKNTSVVHTRPNAVVFEGFLNEKVNSTAMFRRPAKQYQSDPSEFYGLGGVSNADKSRSKEDLKDHKPPCVYNYKYKEYFAAPLAYVHGQKYKTGDVVHRFDSSSPPQKEYFEAVKDQEVASIQDLSDTDYWQTKSSFLFHDNRNPSLIEKQDIKEVMLFGFGVEMHRWRKIDDSSAYISNSDYELLPDDEDSRVELSESDHKENYTRFEVTGRNEADVSRGGFFSSRLGAKGNQPVETSFESLNLIAGGKNVGIDSSVSFRDEPPLIRKDGLAQSTEYDYMLIPYDSFGSGIAWIPDRVQVPSYLSFSQDENGAIGTLDFDAPFPPEDVKIGGANKTFFLEWSRPSVSGSDDVDFYNLYYINDTRPLYDRLGLRGSDETISDGDVLRLNYSDYEHDSSEFHYIDLDFEAKVGSNYGTAQDWSPTQTYTDEYVKHRPRSDSSKSYRLYKATPIVDEDGVVVSNSGKIPGQSSSWQEQANLQLWENGAIVHRDNIIYNEYSSSKNYNILYYDKSKDYVAGQVVFSEEGLCYRCNNFIDNTSSQNDFASVDWTLIDGVVLKSYVIPSSDTSLTITATTNDKGYFFFESVDRTNNRSKFHVNPSFAQFDNNAYSYELGKSQLKDIGNFEQELSEEFPGSIMLRPSDPFTVDPTNTTNAKIKWSAHYLYNGGFGYFIPAGEMLLNSPHLVGGAPQEFVRYIYWNPTYGYDTTDTTWKLRSPHGLSIRENQLPYQRKDSAFVALDAPLRISTEIYDRISTTEWVAKSDSDPTLPRIVHTDPLDAVNYYEFKKSDYIDVAASLKDSDKDVDDKDADTELEYVSYYSFATGNPASSIYNYLDDTSDGDWLSDSTVYNAIEPQPLVDQLNKIDDANYLSNNKIHFLDEPAGHGEFGLHIPKSDVLKTLEKDSAPTSSLLMDGGFMICRVDLIDGNYSHTINFEVFNEATIGQANISNATITNAQITDLRADKITAGEIGAHRIQIGNGLIPVIENGKLVDDQNDSSSGNPDDPITNTDSDYRYGSITSKDFGHLTMGKPGFFISGDGQFGFQTTNGGIYLRNGLNPDRSEGNRPTELVIRGSLIQENSDPFIKMEMNTSSQFITFDEHSDNHFYYLDSDGRYKTYGTQTQVTRPSDGRITINYKINNAYHSDGSPYDINELKFEMFPDADESRSVDISDFFKLIESDDTGAYETRWVNRGDYIEHGYDLRSYLESTPSLEYLTQAEYDNLINPAADSYSRISVLVRSVLNYIKIGGTEIISSSDYASLSTSAKTEYQTQDSINVFDTSSSLGLSDIDDINSGGSLTFDFVGGRDGIHDGNNNQMIFFTGQGISDDAGDSDDEFSKIEQALNEIDALDVNEMDTSKKIYPIADSMTVRMKIIGRADLWRSSKTYLFGDLVSYEGEIYRAKKVSNNNRSDPQPPMEAGTLSNYWQESSASEIVLEQKSITISRKDQPTNLAKIDLVFEGEQIIKDSTGSVFVYPELRYGTEVFSLKSHAPAYADWIQTQRKQLAVYQSFPNKKYDDKYCLIAEGSDLGTLGFESTDQDVLRGKTTYFLVDKGYNVSDFVDGIGQQDFDEMGVVASLDVADQSDGFSVGLIQLDKSDKFISRGIEDKTTAANNVGNRWQLNAISKEIDATVSFTLPNRTTLEQEVKIKIDAAVGEYIKRSDIKIENLDPTPVTLCSFDGSGFSKLQLIELGIEDLTYGDESKKNAYGRIYFTVDSKAHVSEIVLKSDVIVTRSNTLRVEQHQDDIQKVRLSPSHTNARRVDWGTWEDDIQSFEYSLLDFKTDTNNFKGYWNSSSTYSAGDIVVYKFNRYKSVGNTTNQEPTSLPLVWQEVSYQGIKNNSFNENILINTSIPAYPSFRVSFLKPFISYEIGGFDPNVVPTKLRRSENIVPIQLFMGQENITDEASLSSAPFSLDLVPSLGYVVTHKRLIGDSSGQTGLWPKTTANADAVDVVIKDLQNSSSGATEGVYYESGKWKYKDPAGVVIEIDDAGDYLFYLPPTKEDVGFGAEYGATKISLKATYKRYDVPVPFAGARGTLSNTNDGKVDYDTFEDIETINVLRVTQGESPVVAVIENENVEIPVNSRGSILNAVSQASTESEVEIATVNGSSQIIRSGDVIKVGSLEFEPDVTTDVLFFKCTSPAVISDGAELIIQLSSDVGSVNPGDTGKFYKEITPGQPASTIGFSDDGNSGHGTHDLVVKNTSGDVVGSFELPSEFLHGIAYLADTGVSSVNPVSLSNASIGLHARTYRNGSGALISGLTFQGDAHAFEAGDTIMYRHNGVDDVFYTYQPIFYINHLFKYYQNSSYWKSPMDVNAQRSFPARIQGQSGATISYRAGLWTKDKLYVGTAQKREVVRHGSRYYITTEQASEIAWSAKTASSQSPPYAFNGASKFSNDAGSRLTNAGLTPEVRFRPDFVTNKEFNIVAVWEDFGAQVESVATNLLLATDVLIQRGIVAGLENTHDAFFASQIDSKYLDSDTGTLPLNLSDLASWQPTLPSTSNRFFSENKYLQISTGNTLSEAEYKTAVNDGDPPENYSMLSADVVAESANTDQLAHYNSVNSNSTYATKTWKIPFTNVPGFFIGYHKIKYTKHSGQDNIWASINDEDSLPMMEFRSHTGNFFRWDGLKVEMYGSVINGSINPKNIEVSYGYNGALQVNLGDDVYGGQIFCGGGFGNYIPDSTFALGSSIVGGGNNSVFGKFSVIGGGHGNIANSDFSFVGSGFGNTVGEFPQANDWTHTAGDFNAIVTGFGNKILGGSSYSFIGSGFSNTIDGGGASDDSSDFCSILNGQNNNISCEQNTDTTFYNENTEGSRKLDEQRSTVASAMAAIRMSNGKYSSFSIFKNLTELKTGMFVVNGVKIDGNGVFLACDIEDYTSGSLTAKMKLEMVDYEAYVASRSDLDNYYNDPLNQWGYDGLPEVGVQTRSRYEFGKSHYSFFGFCYNITFNPTHSPYVHIQGVGWVLMNIGEDNNIYYLKEEDIQTAVSLSTNGEIATPTWTKAVAPTSEPIYAAAVNLTDPTSSLHNLGFVELTNVSQKGEYFYNTITGGSSNLISKGVNCAIVGSSSSAIIDLKRAVIAGASNRAIGSSSNRQSGVDRTALDMQKGVTIIGSENNYDVSLANWAYEDLQTSVIGSSNTVIGTRKSVVIGSNNQIKGAETLTHVNFEKITGEDVNILGTNNVVQNSGLFCRNLGIFGSNFVLQSQEQVVNSYYIGNPFPAGGLLSRVFVAADGGAYFTGDVVSFALSDRKYKKNIKVIDNPLDKVLKIRGVSFDWKDNQNVYEGRDVGVIAQEVEKVLPEIVETRKAGKAVKYEKLTPLLIEAIKQQQSNIDDLKSQVQSLTLAVNKLQENS